VSYDQLPRMVAGMLADPVHSCQVLGKKTAGGVSIALCWPLATLPRLQILQETGCSCLSPLPSPHNLFPSLSLLLYTLRSRVSYFTTPPIGTPSEDI
jgi:hypothetical protein